MEQFSKILIKSEANFPEVPRPLVELLDSFPITGIDAPISSSELPNFYRHFVLLHSSNIFLGITDHANYLLTDILLNLSIRH